MRLRQTLALTAATLAVGVATTIGQPLVTLPIQIKFTAHDQGHLVERSNSASAKIERIRITNREILDALDVSPTSQLAIVIDSDYQTRVMAGSTDVTQSIGSFFPLGTVGLDVILDPDFEFDVMIEEMNRHGAVVGLSAKRSASSGSAKFTFASAPDVFGILPHPRKWPIEFEGVSLLNATLTAQHSAKGRSVSWSQTATFTGTAVDGSDTILVTTGTWTVKGKGSL